MFVCLDDKHKVKVGEPGFPLVAAERGRQALIHASTNLQAGNHDFSVFSITPSVTFMVSIPEEFSISWYTGQVNVLFKDTIFEPSSPSRHSAEVANIFMKDSSVDYPVLFLYADGGPDHRVAYIFKCQTYFDFIV